jgi:thiamine pyrophosphate-dependent acetolactate synthase large subunit-like protein
MQKLEEKAKKLGRKAFITHVDGAKLLGEGYETTIWVQCDIDELLEAAQKEIDKKQELLYMEISYAQKREKEIQKLLNERLEWKQKLQQIFDECEEVQIHFPNWLKEKFGGLLKEEKEAKP